MLTCPRATTRPHRNRWIEREMAKRFTIKPGAAIAPISPPPSALGTTSKSSGSVIGLFLGLIAFNIAAWAWALAVCQGRPALLGAALLAWVFGLRHAVDADHIAAIDNTVRKLMQQSERPVTTGLFFSLGLALLSIRSRWRVP